MACVVYVLHFEKPFHHAQHYVGSTDVELFEQRMRQHALGLGARLTSAVVRSGIRIFLGRSFYRDDRAYERTIKRSGHPRRYCEICRKGVKPDLFACSIANGITPTTPVGDAVIGWPERKLRKV